MSLTPKLQLANDRGLAGAGFWAIGYERGLPAYTRLIASFRADKLVAASAPPESASAGSASGWPAPTAPFSVPSP
jgi:hypothetical protein